jgi:hypothetical protein
MNPALLRRVLRSMPLLVALLALGPGLAAQSTGHTAGARGEPEARFLPVPSDVLTPNVRQNTPNLKIALRAGINRTAYSNDRYLDNTLLDVGKVAGETDVYGSAAGFGYLAGLDVEYPFTTGLSLLMSVSYDRIHFGNNGPVQELCQSPTGAISLASSVHSFDATIDYAKLAAALKVNFSNFYLMLGLTTAHPFSSSLTRRRALGGAGCFFPGTTDRVIEEEGEVPSLSSLHYSFRFGGGLIYHIGERLQFSPELTLDFGSNRINKSPGSDIGVYSVSAVIRYDL